MCDQCNYCAPQNIELKKHILNKHSGKQGGYNCGNCNSWFRRQNKLKMHIAVKHNEESIEERSLKLEDSLCKESTLKAETGLEMNEKEKNIIGDRKKSDCEYCSFAASSSSAMTIHMAEWHKDLAAIEVCRKFSLI